MNGGMDGGGLDGRGDTGIGGGEDGGGREGGGPAGGDCGGSGGGGAHSDDWPANRISAPSWDAPLPHAVANVASMYPLLDEKKNCTPLMAWLSLSEFGSLGLSPGRPGTVPVNVRPSSSMRTDVYTVLPDDGRNGVFT